MSHELAAERVKAKVQDAIAQALAGESEMVLSWVCLVEAMGADGRRGVWTLTHDDAMPWDTLGLLDYAHQSEQAHAVIVAEDAP